LVVGIRNEPNIEEGVTKIIAQMCKIIDGRKTAFKTFKSSGLQFLVSQRRQSG
jgi:hypothetical protein